MVPSGGKSPDFILLCPAFDAASGCLTSSLGSVRPVRELHVLASSFVVNSSVLTLLQDVTRLQQMLEQWCMWNRTLISLSLPRLPSLFVPFVQVMVGWFMRTVCHQILRIKEITEYLTRCLNQSMIM